MKTTGTRSLVLLALLAAFLFGLVWFTGEFALDGGSWAMQAYNGHLKGGGQLSYAGQVLDRNGVVLAQSVDGQRQYPPDEATRRACLHVVGDSGGAISTSVQSLYRAELAGYNLFTGLAAPDGSSLGNDVRLTIDSRLQAAAYQALGGKNGAVAVYNYRTGEVLCLVSAPTFDPANVPGDLETNSAYEGVYLNRALSATYPPGSTFKVVTAAAAIERIPDLDARTFTCTGSAVINNNEITCDGVHGEIHFADGLAKSCNIVFAELAVELGADAMTETAEKMGFNCSFSLEGVDTKPSSYDVSGAEAHELAWSGIGQYTDLANPLHMMILMGAVANGGEAVQPYLVQEVSSPLGLPGKTGAGSAGPRLLDETTAARLEAYLRYTITSYYGDETFPGLEVCAKTGTAEVGGGKQPCGWIVGFSQREDLPLAFAVAVEEGGYGRSSALPVASAVLQAAAAG